MESDPCAGVSGADRGRRRAFCRSAGDDGPGDSDPPLPVQIPGTIKKELFQEEGWLGVRPPLVSLFLSGPWVCRPFFEVRSSGYRKIK